MVCRYSGVPCRFNSISAEKREEMGGKETPTTSFTAFPSWDRLFSRSSLPGNGRAVRKSVRTNSPSTPPEGDRPHLAEPSLSSMLPDRGGGSTSRRGLQEGAPGGVEGAPPLRFRSPSSHATGFELKMRSFSLAACIPSNCWAKVKSRHFFLFTTQWVRARSQPTMARTARVVDHPSFRQTRGGEEGGVPRYRTDAVSNLKCTPRRSCGGGGERRQQ